MSFVNSFLQIILAAVGAVFAVYFSQFLIKKNRNISEETSAIAVLEGNRIHLDVHGHPSPKEIEQAILLAIGRHNKYTEDLRAVFVVNQKNEEELIEFGEALRKIGRHDEAISSLNEALQINPEHHGAWFQRGVTLGELKRLDEAVESYEQAVIYNPQYVEAWLNKGIILSSQRKSKEARYAFREVLKIDPKHHIARSFYRIF